MRRCILEKRKFHSRPLNEAQGPTICDDRLWAKEASVLPCNDRKDLSRAVSATRRFLRLSETQHPDRCCQHTNADRTWEKTGLSLALARILRVRTLPKCHADWL